MKMMRSALPLFPVGIQKFIALSICTFGVYQVYWCYDNWRRIGNATGERFSPLWRSIFAPVWCFSLFSRIHRMAAEHSVEAPWTPSSSALLYVCLLLAWLAPYPYALLGHFAVVSFLGANASAQSINRLHGGKVTESPNEAYSPLNIATMVVGSVLVGATFFATLMPLVGSR